MKIYLIDDEDIIRAGEAAIVRDCCPGDEVLDFKTEREFLEKAKEAPCDVAFIDIHLGGGADGIHLAEKLKMITPNVNIIFLTAYDRYYREAIHLRASGYLLKPLMKSDVLEELENLRYEVERGSKKLQVTCFGNFDVKKSDGSPLHFERSKSKEAFAYLIHLNGSSCTIRELAAVLFEDEPFDRKNQVYIQKIISSLMKSLREAGVESVIEKGFNSLAVNVSLVDCDYYEFLEENKERRFSRPEMYMEQYSWAMY